MKRMFAMAALLAVATVPGAAKDKPKESVNYAPSWEAAVEEAKFLNVPIVVHSHGFY